MLKIEFEELKVSTRSRRELVDMTGRIEDSVKKSGVRSGICLVSAIHTTAAMVVNEDESGLLEDILSKVEKDFPRGVGWLHDRIDDNADAHLASTFIGSSKIFPIRESDLIRGTWQNIFLLEMDGPRDRTVIVEILGE